MPVVLPVRMLAVVVVVQHKLPLLAAFEAWSRPLAVPSRRSSSTDPPRTKTSGRVDLATRWH